jgi:hypothetical protein
MKNIKFPDNKKFIFTIIDDTDDAYLETIKPVYDLLYENGLRTTKTVWVYPVRDPERSKGDSLQRPEYKEHILDLQKKGFEIAMHNVGSGDFERPEIIEGIKTFENIFGQTPKHHVNHSYNPDNIYCGSKRFSFPLNLVVKKMYSQYDSFFGEMKDSKHFWGDLHKKHITYGRNYEIDQLNTFGKNPYMPYKDKVYDEFANYWYSSTFASNQWMFNQRVNKKTIDQLEKDGGICILYTHLGYYHKNGKIDEGFQKAIEYLGAKKTGWYIPVNEVLDFLMEKKMENGTAEYIPFWFKKRLEVHSLITRIKYRYFVKKDDYHFKLSDEYNDNAEIKQTI